MPARFLGDKQSVRDIGGGWTEGGEGEGEEEGSEPVLEAGPALQVPEDGIYVVFGWKDGQGGQALPA